MLVIASSLVIALSLALLAIVAGMMLLAQAKREVLGSFFKFVSWFVVIIGFVGILCLGAHCIMWCHSGCTMNKEHMGMMDHKDRCMDPHMKGCCNMKMGCDDHGMMNKECNDEKMGSCHDMKGDSNCRMGSEKDKDSVIMKKK